MGKKVRRLYEQFQPSQYKLELKPDKNTMRFQGTVEIIGKKTGRPSNRITLHQKDLKITKASLQHHSKQGIEEVLLTRTNNQQTYDELRLHTENLLYPGLYTIKLEFEAGITKPMHGLYPCYFEHEGKQKMLLATQFESHHAREVFPCIDEPEAKASFELCLVTPQNEQVLANTPVKTQQPIENGLQKTLFETTPVMSTYLLAFVTGEMHGASAKTAGGIEMRTWATVAQPLESLEYANNEAVNILEFFTDYFQTAFPLQKCDQVALPDFESGAMENWGLITYREIALLADPSNRSQSSEQYVSMVVAHELSHQWFGNLVTMKWWDDLWLNESFASLMEHIALDALHPDWFQWEQYTASDVIACSSRDVFKDVQPVHVDVNHPDEIGTLFDPAIVYAKGGRLLKMLREYIGDDAFRSGLKSYFAKHAYKNTIGDDLWAEMSAASHKDIKSFMDPWLAQSGMPLINVTQDKADIMIEQKRFILDDENDTSLWPIPLLADQKLETDIISSATAKISKPETGSPVIFNHNGSGHMLVRYGDDQTRASIAQAFGMQSLKPESRINILNDLLLLARRGDAALVDSFDVIEQSADEPRDAVWMMMSRSIGTGLGLTEGDEQTEQNIKNFRRKLAHKWYDDLGWDDGPADDPNRKALRQTILSIMVASEDSNALAETHKRYEKADSVAKLPAEQRAMIVSAIVKSGADVIEELIKEYKTTPNPDIQLAICAGLTNTKDPKIGDYLIEKALGSNGFVRPQDIFRWFAYLMRNRHSRQSTWNWLQTDWKRLESLFGDSKSFEYFVVYSAGPINTSEWQQKFTEFFTPKTEVVALRRNINIALSEISARVAFRQREEARVKEFFSKYQLVQ